MTTQHVGCGWGAVHDKKQEKCYDVNVVGLDSLSVQANHVQQLVANLKIYV